MIDVHSHIIPGVDDGAKEIKESAEMIKEAKKAGFTDIILTPHFILNYYENLPEEIELWESGLKMVAKKNNISINLYSGMEIYANAEIVKLLNEEKVLGLANTNYILIELPLNSEIKYFDTMIFNLISKDFIPIIAHPERYKYIQDNSDMLIEYIEKGCLIQCNYGSIIGLYGKAAEKTIKKFLKEDLVDFLGSDCHHKNTIYPLIPKAINKLKKIVGTDKTYEITIKNPSKIIKQE